MTSSQCIDREPVIKAGLTDLVARHYYQPRVHPDVAQLVPVCQPWDPGRCVSTPWTAPERRRVGLRQHRAIIRAAFFFMATPTTEIYTLSLHDALPIWHCLQR